MESLNWFSNQKLKQPELNEYYWHQGFFHNSFEDSSVYRRDLNELICRDLALFTLGGIEEKRILDVGCGTGLYSLTFLKMGAFFVAGQDLNPDSIEKAIEDCSKSGFNNFEFKVGDCQQLQFDDNTFDYVFSGDVFEHITFQQKRAFVQEIFRVLKPGGVFTIKTPNKDYLSLTNFLRRLLAIIRLKNPFSINIPHTKNNPNNEHHGLATYKQYKFILRNSMFHEPVVTHVPLIKNRFTWMIWHLMPRCKYLNPNIIISVKKSIFYGIYG